MSAATDSVGAVTVVGQPSLFSADLLTPEIRDLGGLLAAHGHTAGGPGGPRLSILLTEPWRAHALRAECVRRDVAAEVKDVAGGTRGALLLRTERSTRLRDLAEAWTRGAVKATPTELAVDAGLLRLWAIASGRPGPTGYLLGLDPHAPGTHQPLVAALGRGGLTGSLVGVQSVGFAVRITGTKRLARLAEMIGDVPKAAPKGSWPTPRG